MPTVLGSRHRQNDDEVDYHLDVKVAIQATAQMASDKEAVGLSRVHTCMNLSESCPYKIVVYSVLKVKHINTTRMHTISCQFIPFIYGPLGEQILSSIQPSLPSVKSSSYFT